MATKSGTIKPSFLYIDLLTADSISNEAWSLTLMMCCSKKRYFTFGAYNSTVRSVLLTLLGRSSSQFDNESSFPSRLTSSWIIARLCFRPKLSKFQTLSCGIARGNSQFDWCAEFAVPQSVQRAPQQIVSLRWMTLPIQLPRTIGMW